MTKEHKIFAIERIKWDEQLHDAVKGEIEHAQETGELSDRRLPMSGEEKAAWIGPNFDPQAFVLFFEARPRVLWVDEIYVSPAFRRLGMANALMQHVETYARQNGFHRIEYGTDIDNRASRLLGASRGFNEWSIGLARDIPPDPPQRLATATDLNGDDIPF